MNQAQIRRWWIVFILISNSTLLGYLFYFQNPAGLVAGLPGAWVALLLIMITVFIINSLFAWYYLQKPDLREVFGGTPDQGGDR